eukprot:749931-Hanusia_phi.AAC.2
MSSFFVQLTQCQAISFTPAHIAALAHAYTRAVSDAQDAAAAAAAAEEGEEDEMILCSGRLGREIVSHPCRSCQEVRSSSLQREG